MCWGSIQPPAHEPISNLSVRRVPWRLAVEQVFSIRYSQLFSSPCGIRSGFVNTPNEAKLDMEILEDRQTYSDSYC